MRHIVFVACILLTTFTSCLDDSSVYDYTKLNAPEWNTSAIVFEFRTGETARFEASPYFTWAGDSAQRASEVRYEWTYGDVVFGTELDFEIPTNEFLNKIGMTNIDNENHYGLFNVIEKETGVTYSMRFDFKVLSTYASGDWVVISEKGSDTKLSYIRRARVDNQVVYSLTEDVYLTANGEDIVGRPLGMVRSEGSINIGLLGTMTIFTTDNVYEVNNESFMKVGHMEDAPCKVVARTDVYGMTDNKGQHTFVTDENGQLYRRMMSNNSLGGSFETTPLVLDEKGYRITQFGLQRQQFVNQPCWDELNRRFVYITTYESGEATDSPFGPIFTGETYRLSKLVAPTPMQGTEDAIAQKCAPVWNMPEGTEVLAMMFAKQSGNPFTGYNDLWTMIYNDASGNTHLTEFMINSQGQIIDGTDLTNQPFPGGNLTKESLFIESCNPYEYYYNKMNFLVYSKGNEIRWLDRSNAFNDNAYITLPDADDKVTYMGWTAWANYGALVVGTEQGKLYIYEATISNSGATGTNPLLPNPKILAEFDLGGRVVSAKELDCERSVYMKEKY